VLANVALPVLMSISASIRRATVCTLATGEAT
jgi:hypothetical protein